MYYYLSLNVYALYLNMKEKLSVVKLVLHI